MWSTTDAVDGALRKQVIDRLQETFSMIYMVKPHNFIFWKFPYARYTTVCRFQKANRPSEATFVDAKE